MIPLTLKDRKLLEEKGISPDFFYQQLQTFRKGISHTILDRPCKIDDGIKQFSHTDLEHYAYLFKQAMASGRITKFVPAAGAASRMFKTLLTTFEQNHLEQGAQILSNNLSSRSKDIEGMELFFHKLESFAFFADLKAKLADQGIQNPEKTYPKNWRAILKTLLFPSGLNYANLPKGILPFHQYADHIRTPIEEHIREGCAYTIDSSETVRIHFAISQEHEQLIQEHITQVLKRIQSSNINFDITLSYQPSYTDTIAVDLDNHPIRNSSGELIFRPGGHGALLENLCNLQGDIVFIKNIDNVVPECLADQHNFHKTALAGYLVTIQQQLFTYLEKLSLKYLQENQLSEIFEFAQRILGISTPSNTKAQSPELQQQFLFKRLNRPLRVCGLVPNISQPGGGPFWVRQSDGSKALQIVEPTQFDNDSNEQQMIWRSGTHFNPVDIVCGVRNFRNKPFKLHDFANLKGGLISMKFHEGQNIRALELPGLWNEAMAYWNTVFIEVPPSTFNPVKTVFDLLHK